MAVFSFARSRMLPRGAAAPRLSLRDMLALYRQRRALLRLDAAALADLGLSKQEAVAEANRPFWDAPAYWQCSARKR